MRTIIATTILTLVVLFALRAPSSEAAPLKSCKQLEAQLELALQHERLMRKMASACHDCLAGDLADCAIAPPSGGTCTAWDQAYQDAHREASNAKLRWDLAGCILPW